ncbi:MAG: hypothetical protein FWE80_01810 [Oscillospiraceae bacterium]|nr:hypothetical protein [Oscillospiraceae bacterium]
MSEPITDIIWLEPPKDAEYCQILHVDDTHALVGESETSIGTTHPPEVYHYYTPDGLQWSYKPPVLFYDWDIYPLKNDSYALVGRDHESNIEHIILLDRQGNATRQPGWPYSRNDRVTPDEDDGLYVFAQRYNLSKNLITLLHITPRGIEEETPLIFPADPEFSISGSYWESGGTGIADGSGGFYLSTYLEYHDSSASFTRLLHIDANRSVSMKISIEKYSFGDSAFVTEKGNLRCVLTVAEEQHTLLEFDAGCHVVYEKDVDIEKYVYMIHPHGNIFIGVSGCGSANTPIQLLRIDEKGEVFEISFDFKDHVMTDSNHVHPEFVELDDGFILIYDVWEFDNERHFIHVERYDDYLRLRSCATFGDSEDTKYLLGKIHESGITRSGILWALE